MIEPETAAPQAELDPQNAVSEPDSTVIVSAPKSETAAAERQADTAGVTPAEAVAGAPAEMQTAAIPDEAEAAAPDAAESALNEIKRKDRFTGKIVKTMLAGALVDIGLGVPGVIHISQLAATPVNRTEDVVKEGDEVQVWVRRVFPKKGRVELTMIEPLAFDWRDLEEGMVFKGKVTRIENFGVFVDIGAERPGLVHISEMTHDYIKSPGDVVKEGEEVEVKVLAVIRQKKQIKLSMKALVEAPAKILKEMQQQPREAQSRGRRDPIAEFEASEPEEPTLTAMEMALRDAMERSKERDERDERDDDDAPAGRAASGRGKRKGRGNTTSDEIESILERTLQHKLRTNK
jgi:predicted RNA-binding protein with RPS1 domain